MVKSCLFQLIIFLFDWKTVINRNNLLLIKITAQKFNDAKEDNIGYTILFINIQSVLRYSPVQIR